jgi:acetyltransferase
MPEAEPTLDAFFTPRAIAVVGASRDPRKLGYIILDNLLRARFEGAVFPVNPGAESVLGLDAFATVSAVPGPVDLAVIVVPASHVPALIDDCAAKSVPAAVVISAGFREAGPEGLALECEVVRRARAGGIRVIGPNSVGIINTFAGLNATFADTQPLSYEVALVSQSGAVATAILDWARAIGVGFSKFVSLGNMADVTEVELFEYLASDPQTKVIISYLEGFSDARACFEAARHITRRKPVVVMKVGRSASGAKAASSHTGALASSDAIVDAAFRQAGIIRADTMDELFDLTLSFAYMPPPRGPRLAIVTNAGGPGVMATDAAERAGLQLARLCDETQTGLRAALPANASVGNPVDVLGDARPDRYRDAVELVLADPGVDALVVLLTPQAMTNAKRTAETIISLARGQSKPVMAVYMGGDAVAEGRVMLDMAQVPAFHYPERAVRALGAMWAYGRYLQDP